MGRLRRLLGSVGGQVIRDPLLILTVDRRGKCHVDVFADIPRADQARILRDLADQIDAHALLSDRMN